MSNPSDTLDASNHATEGRDSHLSLGRKLRRLRESLGLSQRELAKRAGLTNSSISTVEQGLVSPSVQSLERILAAFPLSLVDFFRWREHLEPPCMLTCEHLLDRALHPALGVIQQPLAQHLGAISPGVDMQRWQLLAGAEAPLACASSGDLLLTLVCGNLVLHVGDSPLLLAPGDAARLPAGHYYRLANPYGQSAELIVAGVLPPAAYSAC